MKKMLTPFFIAVFFYCCQSDQNATLSKDIVTQTQLTEIIKQKDYSLVYFWTTWCGPCRKTLSLTLPILEKSLNTSKVQLLVVAVSKDEEKIKAIVNKSALQAQKFRLAFSGPDIYLTHKVVLKNTLESIFPKNDVWNNSVPVFVLVDKNLNIIARKIPTELGEAMTFLIAMEKSEESRLLVKTSD